MANTRIGIDITMSIDREMSVSTHPRKNPAMVPRMTPMKTDRPVAMKATWSEVRAP